MLIFGMGYSASRLAARLRALGWRITGVRREAHGEDILAFGDREAVFFALAMWPFYALTGRVVEIVGEEEQAGCDDADRPEERTYQFCHDRQIGPQAGGGVADILVTDDADHRSKQ